jgi:hypothetical protein
MIKNLLDIETKEIIEIIETEIAIKNIKSKEIKEMESMMIVEIEEIAIDPGKKIENSKNKNKKIQNSKLRLYLLKFLCQLKYQCH